MASVIIPVYYNEGTLEATYDRLSDEVISQQPDCRFEVVFVDDGSGDGSYHEMCRVQSAHPAAVRVLKLTRNFGQVSAIMAGLTMAMGDVAIVVSADGQDPLGLMNDMLAAYRNELVDVVIAARDSRDESAYRSWTSGLFYTLMRRLSFPNMPPGGFDYFLLSRRAKETLLRNWEAHPFLQGQVLWMGYPMLQLTYRRRERLVGRSRWTFRRKLTYLLDGTLSYSYVPIRAISFVGFLAALLGFAYAFVVLFVRLTIGSPVQGWAPLMIVVLIMGGVQMLMLGILGEYLWRTLAQVRRREPYIVDVARNSAAGAPTIQDPAASPVSVEVADMKGFL